MMRTCQIKMKKKTIYLYDKSHTDKHTQSLHKTRDDVTRIAKSTKNKTKFWDEEEGKYLRNTTVPIAEIDSKDEKKEIKLWQSANNKKSATEWIYNGSINTNTTNSHSLAHLKSENEPPQKKKRRKKDPTEKCRKWDRSPERCHTTLAQQFS